MTDKKILRALFLRHYNEMLRLARTLLYDDMEAEDTVQDVFLKLGQSDILSLTPDPSPRRGENGETTPPAPRGQLEEGYKMRAYLMTAVRNGCINRIRQMSFADRFRKLYPLEFNDDWRGCRRSMPFATMPRLILGSRTSASSACALRKT